MRPEQLQQLIDEWPLNYKKLTLFAKYRLGQCYWRGEQSDLVPGGYQPEDLAQEAILDVAEGRRTWDPIAEPELFRFLCGVVNSKISNFSTRLENRVETRTQEETAENMPIQELAPAAVLEDKEFVLGFVTYLENERELSEVVACYINGCTDRADIANKLSVSPEEITNRKKRLRRKANEYIDKLAPSANDEHDNLNL